MIITRPAWELLVKAYRYEQAASALRSKANAIFARRKEKEKAR